MPKEINYKFEQLLDTVKRLRGADGCPWDQKQTPQTLKIYLQEETAELVEAIDANDFDNIREELGDLLFHIVFFSRMYQEQERFDLADVLESITAKMIRRHPHVFENQPFSSEEELRRNWETIKAAEKKKIG